jgi:YVTN family beta-propeller protein
MMMKNLSRHVFVQRAFYLGVLLLVTTIIVPGDANAQPFAYIPISGSDSVSIIDTATNIVVGTTQVGGSAFGGGLSVLPDGVAITPDANRVYVTNYRDNRVYIIDTETNTVVGFVSVGSTPSGIAMAPDGSVVYVANAGDTITPEPNSNTISVIETATNTVIATIPVQEGPSDLAVTPDGRRLYVANAFRGSLSVIDTASNTLLLSLQGLSFASGVVVNSAGTKVYATATGGLYVIDTLTNSVVAVVPLGCGPRGVTVTPDGRLIYAASYCDGTVYVIDGDTNFIITTVPVGVGVMGVAAAPDGQHVYVTNRIEGFVSVIETSSNKVIDRIPTGPSSAFEQFIGPRPLVVAVTIDIKPGSFPNSINFGSGGTVPVAILSSATFDANAVDATSVTLAGAHVRLRGRGTPMASSVDVNGDGRLDVILHVSTEALQLSENDTEAVLEGQTYSGTKIRGVDSVRIVP